MRVNVGNVVMVNHRNFNDELQASMFLVVYCDCDDKGLEDSDTFTAIKISTKPGQYNIPLDQEHLPFLQYDSSMNCCDIFRFMNSQVYRIVGTISPYYMNRIIIQTTHYFQRLQKQMINSIPEKYLFEDLETVEGVINHEEDQSETSVPKSSTLF